MFCERCIFKADVKRCWAHGFSWFLVFWGFFFTSSPHLSRLFKDRRPQWTVAVKMLILFTVELCAMIRLVSRQALSQRKKANTLFLRSQCASLCQLQMGKLASVPPATLPVSVFKVRGEGRIYKRGIFCVAIQKDSERIPNKYCSWPWNTFARGHNERRTGLRRKPVNDRAPRDDTAGPRIHLYIWYSLCKTPEVSASRAENHINIKEMHPGGLWVIKGKRQELRRLTPVQGLVLDKRHVVEGVRNPPTSILPPPTSHLPPSSAASQPSHYTQSQWFARNEFASKQQEK